jgi:hypothetical protein
VSWPLFPHSIRWDKATEQERTDFCGAKARMSRMAQGLPATVTDPSALDLVARNILIARPQREADAQVAIKPSRPGP